MFRQLVKINNKNLLYSYDRHFSQTTSKQSVIEVKSDDKTGYSIISLNRPPVNSLNLDIFIEFSKVLDDLTANKSRGVVLTAASKNVFSAGLDINELYKPDWVRFKEYWMLFQETWCKLFNAPFLVACCINGHAPAGGCALAIACDYRVMCDGFFIGLNETEVGIVAPIFLRMQMENIIGYRKTEQSLISGSMFTTQQARDIGLIDETARSKDDAMEKCIKWLNKSKNVEYSACIATKQSIRQNTLKVTKDHWDEIQETMATLLREPFTRRSVEAFFHKIKDKK